MINRYFHFEIWSDFILLESLYIFAFTNFFLYLEKKKFSLLIQKSSLRSQCFLRGDFYKEEGEKIRGPFDAEQSITCNFLPLNALLVVMDQVIPEIVFSGTWNQGCMHTKNRVKIKERQMILWNSCSFILQRRKFIRNQTSKNSKCMLIIGILCGIFPMPLQGQKSGIFKIWYVVIYRSFYT